MLFYSMNNKVARGHQEVLGYFKNCLHIGLFKIKIQVLLSKLQQIVEIIGIITS